MKQSMVSEDTLTATQRRWLRRIRLQQQSGLSVAAYARQQGLAISTFYTMRQRLLPLALTGEEQRPLFQAVTLIQDQPTFPGSLTLAFDLPGELRCSVRADVAASAALLQALARQPS